jgi:hypothetical protein
MQLALPGVTKRTEAALGLASLLGSKEHGKSTGFSVVFTLPNEQQAIKVMCQSHRCLAIEGGVEIGASFIDLDDQIYLTLQKYLT